MKKTITILVLMLISGWANAAFDGGAGTLVSPYQVSTAAQLDDVRNNLSSYFIQTADIDLITYATGIGWVPIGNATTKFTGSYDGGGHKIKHLFINHGGTTDGDYSALFGYINAATIKNIGVECNVTGNSSTAGLVGEADGISTIQNCYTIGYIVGYNSTGGLVGFANCTAGATISNCYSRAIVSGNYYTAGLVGEAWRVIFTNCYSSGQVISNQTQKGGFIGRNINSTANDCFWDTETSGLATSLIGTGKTTAEMKTQATFTNWNFATNPIIWDIDAENSGYPHLHWQAFIHNKYYVKTTGSNSSDGSSWANAFLTFQKALETAQSGDQIWIASGTYKPSVQVGGSGVRFSAFQMVEGVEIYGGFAGTEVSINDRMNFGLGNANETILSGDLNGDDNYSGASWSGTSENCYHVVYNSGNVSYLTSAAILDGFTIKGAYGSQYGGGLVNDGASPTIRNCIFTYNHCYAAGGGVYNYSGKACKPTYTNCLVINNISSNGAGVWCRAAFPTFINTTIANNTSSGDGGAFWSGMGGNTTFNNCILWGNTGGASSTGKQIWSDGIVYLNYSCYSNGTSANYGTITPSNSITTDPIIMNVSKNDYRIVGLSPCLDAGNNAYNSLTTDIRGKTFGRKLLKTDSTTVGTIDMGAYEFKSGFDSINPCAGAVISSQSTATQTQCINGTFVPITVTATATGNVLTYQWYSSATADTTSGTTMGTNSSSYTPLATATGTKYYYCKVSGDCGSPKKSAISGAIITSIPTAMSSQSIATQTKCLGGTFTAISVTATGNNNSFQWYYNANNSNSGGTSLATNNGANTSTYTPQSGADGTLYYYCVVTGSCTTDTSDISGAFITKPLEVPTISGTNSICNHSTGNIYTTETGKSSYIWTVTGGTITDGTGTNAITVTWNTDGAQTVSANYTNSFGCTAVSATVYNVTVKAAPSPVITGSPDNLYNVPKLATYQYSTPLVAGDLYSWSSPKIEGYCSTTARNCVNVHFLDPCCVYGEWTINVTETNPTTGCTSIATKQIYITP